jgi:glycerol uptake operon antiterminator
MTNPMLTSLKEHPIIAAVKNESQLKACLSSNSQVIFILFGDICNIERIVRTVKSANKLAIVHIDFVGGLSNEDITIQYISEHTKLDGIISTKANLLKSAHEKGLITVQRVFMIDSIAFKNVENHIKHGYADFLEILPGVMPKVIKSIATNYKIPIIAGGLILDAEDVNASLESGAVAVSTTNETIWSVHASR